MNFLASFFSKSFDLSMGSQIKATKITKARLLCVNPKYAAREERRRRKENTFCLKTKQII